MATLQVSQTSSRSFRRVLATVCVVRADIMLDNGKPSNIHHSVHVNIYFPYILEKLMEGMEEENLVLVVPMG